ncbi:MAG: 1-acyl-sn-glycerol-3-phosphate acyltransferase [Gammaproteobacteria bacterium]|nr:MAG: 1-acyl-sn-glycerol-3-phosphate acyltransferase [Gammaproteobacteria bacterium]
MATHLSKPALLFQLLRSLIYNIVYTSTVVLFGIFICSIAPFNPRISRWFFIKWSNFNLWSLKVICNLKYKLEGTENIPNKPVVIMPKHQSTFETMALPTFFPQHAWVVKKELMKIPFFGWGLKALRSIAIDRTAGIKSLRMIAKQGEERLKDDLSIIIFPEGTRTEPGTKPDYNIGGAFLAKKNCVEVLPIAHNAGDFWGKSSFLKKPGTIIIRVGKLIETESHTAEEIKIRTRDWIESNMQEISDSYK